MSGVEERRPAGHRRLAPDRRRAPPDQRPPGQGRRDHDDPHATTSAAPTTAARRTPSRSACRRLRSGRGLLRARQGHAGLRPRPRAARRPASARPSSPCPAAAPSARGPIDLHIAGLQKLGAAHHPRARLHPGRGRPASTGPRSHFENKTVTGTENLLMAAALAKGRDGPPQLRPRARGRRPGRAARSRWARRSSGVGDGDDPRSSGVEELGGAAHDIIPDRIEAGTFLVAGALTGGDIVVRGVVPDHVDSVVDKLRAVGRRRRTAGEGGPARRRARPRSGPRTSRPRPTRASRPTCRPSSWSC
ncbi:MAG: hypothetical protein MZV63_64385 [Marinilabiliales bacterium]|nr:hypothetical protein [Marinilabiliales bacterium]